MNDEVKKIIAESYKRLPFDLKKAIVASETRQRLQVMAEKHQLSSDQAADLETEMALVMLGLRPPADLITNIKNALDVPVEKARAIAEDINTEIFRPIRESLKKIHGISEPPPSPPKQETVLSTFQKKELPKPTTDKPESVPKSDLMSPQLRVGEKEKTPTERTIPGGHFENGENHLNREEILAGIENPVPAKPTRPVSDNIVQDKLSGVVRMPRSVEEVKELPPKPSYQTDPYREPIQ